MSTTAQAKARIDSDIRRLCEPYASQLRAFAGAWSMQLAVEKEVRERGAGYRFLAGIWKGEYGTPPEQTE